MNTTASDKFAQAKGSQRTFLALTCAMLAGMSNEVEGAIRTWTGGSAVGSYWGYSANWKGGLLPKDGDDVVFPASASRLVNTNSLVNLDLASITFSSTGYTVRGNTITLSKGIASTAFGSANTLDLDVTLASAQSIECTYKNSHFYVSGNVALGSHTLTTLGAGQLHLGGIVSGTGGLTKNGSGTHWLEGASANTYTGPTLVNSGTLMLDKSGGNAVPYGKLTVGDGLGSANSTIVREQANYQIGNIPITINGDGWLDVGNYYDTVGAITFNGGQAGGTASGTLALNGNVTVNASAQEASFIGQLYLNSTSRMFNVQNGTAVNDLSVPAVIDSGGFVKTGAGVMVLSGSNRFDGEIVINQGTLQTEHDDALGSAIGGTTVTGSGELYLNSTYVTSGEALTLDKPSSSGNALSSSYSTYWTGPVTLSTHVGISSSGGGLNFTGVISGPGGVSLNGPGIYRFSGSSPNTYTGGTHVNDGTLELYTSGGSAIPYGSLTIGNGVGSRDEVEVYEGANNQIGNSVPVTINADGWLTLYSHTDTVGPITFNGGHASSTTGSLRLNGTVTVNASSSEALLEGNVYMGAGTRKFHVADGAASYDLRVDAILSGGGVTKTGNGQMALLQNNTYVGETTVSQGTLYGERDHSFGTSAGGTTVTGSGTLFVYNADIPNEALTLDKPNSSGNALVTDGSVLWFGPVTLADDVGISISGVVDFEGAISGPGGLSLNGTGLCIFYGASANTYAGDTHVNNGSLELRKTSLDGALAGPGDLYVGDGYSSGDVVVVQYWNDYQLDEDVTIHVIPGGKLDLNNFTDTVGPVAMEAGHITTGMGTMILSGDVMAQSVVGVGKARMEGRLSLGTGTRTFTVPLVIGADAIGLLVDADVIGAGAITKAGDGVLALRGDNSYSGLTTVNEGTLAVLSDTALGSTAAGTIAQAGTFLSLASYYASSVHVGDEALTLSGSLWAGQSGFDTSNSWAGPITLAANAKVEVPEDDFLNLTGAIGGSGGFSKTRPGTLILSGSSANTYTGDTHVYGGTMYLDKTYNDGAVSGPGDLYVGDGVSAADSIMVQWRHNFQLDEDVDIHVVPGGKVDLNDYSDTVGSVAMEAGNIDTGAGTLTLSGDVTAQSVVGMGRSEINGQLSLGSTTRTFTVPFVNGAVWPGLMVSADVSGSGGITKDGNGGLGLWGNNSYSGPTTVSDGSLLVFTDAALGSTSAGTIVNANAELLMTRVSTGPIHVGNEPLTLSGTLGAGGTGAFTSNSWAGPVTLAADSLMEIQSATILNLVGAISGPGGFSKNGDGTLIVSGASANTYAGVTHVDGGTLELAKSVANGAIPGDLIIGDGLGGTEADVVRLAAPTQIPNNVDVTIASSGLLDLNNHGEGIDGLSGSGHVDVSGGFLNIGLGDASTEYNGTIYGSGTVGKFGAGTATFTGANTYTGDTSVSSGSLLVNGAHASAVTVGGSGRLGGIGTVGAITSSGTVAPGASAGQLGAGNTMLQSGSTFDVELNGFNLVDYDQLDVNGTATINSANLAISWGYVPAVGDEYTILDNDGADAVTGTFNGLAEGASIVADNVTLQITYVGGTGNDVVLTATEVSPLKDLRITSIAEAGSDVVLSWEGGVPFYVLEKKTALTNDTWLPVTTFMRGTQTNLPMDAPETFYRVSGGN